VGSAVELIFGYHFKAFSGLNDMRNAISIAKIDLSIGISGRGAELSMKTFSPM
jgi:hypothetical protein